MLNMTLPWWEFVARGGIVYVFLIVVIRISGKRQIGQLAPFDLVLLLVLSNAVQNSMNGGDNSLLGGLISATSLIAINYFVGFATFKSKRIEAIVEGRPQLIIHNGKLYKDTMAKMHLTDHELQSALRQAGCTCVDDVHSAVLENNGVLSVTKRKARAETE
ncbi:DUF421 domain-containing protein [Cognatilysobacter segetis]|uniref:DUF421 domain-containing protein n=1 Tax=Cognatilysobacter segetis TaxID=2492394 RepID=UPI00105F546D|nr:YetF domain-containing protein [Lysobacter segetis]